MRHTPPAPLCALCLAALAALSDTAPLTLGEMPPTNAVYTAGETDAAIAAATNAIPAPPSAWPASAVTNAPWVLPPALGGYVQTNHAGAVSLSGPLSLAGPVVVASPEDGSAASGIAVAMGAESSAAGLYSLALGLGAATVEAHPFAFVHSGQFTGVPYFSHGIGTFSVNPPGGLDGVWIGETNLSGHIAARANLLPVASPTVSSGAFALSPETAVYRVAAALSGTAATIPTPDATAIPNQSAYYTFELEVTVDATATTLSGPSGWTWLDGGELPTSASDFSGKTIYIAARLDCAQGVRSVTANVWRIE